MRRCIFPSVNRMFSRRPVLIKSSLPRPGLWTPEIWEKSLFLSFPLATDSEASTLEELYGYCHSHTFSGAQRKAFFSIGTRDRNFWSVSPKENCFRFFISIHNPATHPLPQKWAFVLLGAKSAR